MQHIEPAPVLIVEGILPFVRARSCCAMFDYKIFVDHRRRTRPHPTPSCTGREGARPQPGQRDRAVPDHGQAHARAFVEPSKRNADIIVPNGGENTTAIEMLAHHIRSLIEKANMR